MANLTPINSDEFEEKVLKANRPVLVDFGAPWCGPCKLLDPLLEELAKEHKGEVDVYKVDVDLNPDLVTTYGIMGVPTLILFRYGKIENRLTGFRPKKTIKKMFFGK